MNTTGIMKIDDFSKLLFQEHPEAQNRFRDIPDLNLFLMSYLDHGYMVYPENDQEENNMRLMRQKGVFFITGVQFTKTITDEMRFETRAGKNEFICHSINVPISLKNGSSLVKMIIDKKMKPEIMHELEEKGITYEYLFPDET